MNAENAIFAFTVTVMLLTILVLHGCSSTGRSETSTGQLECVGYCSLDVGNRSSSVRTETSDGAVVERKQETGLNQDQSDIVNE